MENTRFLIIIIFLFGFSIQGCKEKNEIHIEINIFTQKLGNIGEQFPDDFMQLMIPFSPEACSDSTLFLTLNKDNGLWINRLDTTYKENLNIDFSSGLGEKVTKNVSRKIRITKSEFPKLKIGKYLAQNNGKLDYSKLLNFEDRVVILNAKIKGDKVKFGNNNYKLFQNITALKKFISEDICERYNSGKVYSNYAIIYNIDEPVAENSDSGTTIKQNIDFSITGESPLRVDQLVNFINASTINKNVFVWKINGKEIATTLNFSYSFKKPGQYNIELCGNGDCILKTISISEKIPTPISGNVGKIRPVQECPCKPFKIRLRPKTISWTLSSAQEYSIQIINLASSETLTPYTTQSNEIIVADLHLKTTGTYKIIITGICKKSSLCKDVYSDERTFTLNTDHDKIISQCDK